jgi:hypothetical protein
MGVYIKAAVFNPSIKSLKTRYGMTNDYPDNKKMLAWWILWSLDGVSAFSEVIYDHWGLYE